MVERPDSSLLSYSLPLLIALAMITLGTYVVALLLHRFGSPGYCGIWALGALAAYAVNRFVVSPAPYTRVLLLVTCILIYWLATVIFIRWDIVGVTSYADGFAKFPNFLRSFSRDAAIGAILTGFGAHSAYTGVRRVTLLDVG